MVGLNIKFWITVTAFSWVLFSGACAVVGNIPGNVAGQVMNSAGAPYGLVSVQLVDADTNRVAEQMNANDMGNFMFKGVDPGNYIIKIKPIGGGELPSDAKQFRLTPGKTVTQNIIVDPAGRTEDPTD